MCRGFAPGWALVSRSGFAGRYWQYRGAGNRIFEYHGHSLSVVGGDSSLSYDVMGGGTKHGGGTLDGEPTSRGGAFQGGSVLRYVN